MRFALACSLAALAVLLVGCGGKSSSTTTGTTATTTTAADNGITSQTPDQIVKTMQTAVNGATSVHVVGSGTSAGTTLSLDLKLVKDKGGAGHVSIGGLGFDIIRIGQKIYFKASKTFLVHYAGAASASLAGKWFFVSTSTKGLGSLAPFTDLTALMNQILAAPGKLVKGSTTTIAGQPALAVTDSTNGGTLYVATTGPAYPLQLVPGKAKGSGSISFIQWDQPITLTAPAHPLDYSKIGG